MPRLHIALLDGATRPFIKVGRVKSEKNNKLLEKEIIKKLGQPSFSHSFLFPVKHGYLKYTDLLNGGLTLFDIEKLNEAISYLDEVDKIIINFNKPKKDGRKIR